MNKDFRKYVLDHKICVVTNTLGRAGGVFLMSMQSYIDSVPVHNYYIIPGMQGANRNYGLACFKNMVATLLSNDYFDYALYLDDDVFVYDLDLLMREFERFRTGGYCMAGVPDGGVICHRNGTGIFVNTFCSFWNIKALRNDGCAKRMWEYLNTGAAINEGLLDDMRKLAEIARSHCADIREIMHPAEGVAFAETVRHNKDNPTEPNQTPYTWKAYVPGADYEPYYRLENAIVASTGMPIMYLEAYDFHDCYVATKDNGCTSVCCTFDKYVKPYLYHTWYSRLYSKFIGAGGSELARRETERINSIYNYVEMLKEKGCH